MLYHFKTNHYLSVCCYPGNSAVCSRQEHFMGLHVPIFKLAGGGLFLFVSNVSMGNISSCVIFNFCVVSATTITTQKKTTIDCLDTMDQNFR